MCAPSQLAFRVFSATALLMCLRHLAADDFVLPYKPDPPIVVDAQHDDWVRVPNALQLQRKSQATYGNDLWSGPDDLSGEVRLAWRDGGLLVAADVKDDRIVQSFTGGDLWKGDHICVWLDTTPTEDPARNSFGKGQCIIGISPGNFQSGSAKREPEIHVFRPDDTPEAGGQVAARRTDDGYVIEAFIPFSRLRIRSVSQNQEASFEVAISDADSSPAKQETMITSSSDPWDTKRSRLQAMVFGDGNGKALPVSRGSVVLESAEIAPGLSHTTTFKAESITDKKIPCISLKARIHYRSVAGFSTNALQLTVNGKPVGGDRMLNRPARATLRDGRSMSGINTEGAMTLPLTPTFEAIDTDGGYGLMEVPKACEFEFDLSGLVKPGDNTLVLRNQAQSEPASPYIVHVEAVVFSVRNKPEPPPPPKGAPTGELPVIHPSPATGKSFSAVAGKGTTLQFSVAGEKFAVVSRFSSPDGKWNQGSNTFFRHDRKIVEKNQWIEVHDTFTNLGNMDLPILQEHTIDLSSNLRESWLGGLKTGLPRASREDHQNPSIVATTAATCIGLLPLNDEFIVHCTQQLENKQITLADRQFYLPPGASYSAEWAVVAVPAPDFWDWVNAARRLREANFTLPWSFAFLFKTQPVYDWSDSTLTSFLKTKGINFAVKGGDEVRNKNGHYARVTDWLNAPHTVYTDFHARVNRLFPQGVVKTGIYFDGWLDTTEDNVNRFAQDRALDSSGKQIDYGGIHTYLKMFLPTRRPGGFGEEQAKVIDRILDVCDGVYWDEFDLTCAKFSYNHEDGSSADVDQQTFQLLRKKGALALVSRDWNLAQVEKILRQGRPLLVNGSPATRTLRNQKFQAFCETGSISNCRGMVLYSPCALGDHLTERSYVDGYRVMQGALDNGCVYAWYEPKFHEHVAPTAFMFPITPIELHEGYIIGEERIITNRSGYFGWGDQSDFIAHVFDREGRPDETFRVAKVVRDEKHCAEVRLPEGYMAILVRKK